MQNRIVEPLEEMKKLSKQTKEKIEFIKNMAVHLTFVMHCIACLWLFVGRHSVDIYENESYSGSWYQHLTEEQQ